MGKTEWPEAKRIHQESLAVSEELGGRANMAVSLNHLGQISYALGELQETKQYFLTALQTAIEAQAIPVALDALVGLVILQVKEQMTTAEPELAVKEQALEWLTLVLNHPASRKETKDRASSLMSELTAELSPQTITAAQARGQSRKLDEIAVEILAGNRINPV